MVEASELRWFKGNTHAHSNESDGDSPPEQVIEWYREHGYNFLALTDHNVVVPTNRFCSHCRPDFILLQGEEVSVNFNGVPLHLNALHIGETLAPVCGATIPATLRANLEAIARAGGLGQVNHPNFRFAITAADMLAVDNVSFVEIYNGHPAVYNDGDADLRRQSVEAMWDELLSAGMRVYGVAVDDAHHLWEFDPDRANPGRGWIMVRAESLCAPAILSSLRCGDFYASTGIELAELRRDPSLIYLRLKTETACRGPIEFIGRGGRLLSAVDGTEAEYRPVSEDGYVRVRVGGRGPARCWTQPVFV